MEVGVSATDKLELPVFVVLGLVVQLEALRELH